MIFTETPIAGAYIVDIEPSRDERGFFARTYCEREFGAHGLVSHFAQCSVSRNAGRGIVRGLHYQVEPHGETKLVRCSHGAVYDVIADLRRDSPSFLRWAAFELSGENSRSIYIPPLVAHGYQALTDGAELFYQISTPYHPESVRGVRWNDPRLGVKWPIEPPILSARDASYPDLALP